MLIWYACYCNMITFLELFDTSITSHNCPFFFVIRIFKIWSFSSFQVSGSYLIQCRQQWLPYVHQVLRTYLSSNSKFLSFDQHPPWSSHPQPLVTTILLSVSMTSAFLDSTYNWSKYLSKPVPGRWISPHRHVLAASSQRAWTWLCPLRPLPFMGNDWLLQTATRVVLLQSPTQEVHVFLDQWPSGQPGGAPGSLL